MHAKDRRKFFRIDQNVSIELKVVTEREISDHPNPSQFGVSPNFLLLSELQEMDAANGHLLRKIAEKDSNIAAFLNVMHDKIERIAQAIASSEMTMTNAAIQEVNISEGGLQFTSEDAYEPNTCLSIKIVFPESCIGLLLYAKSRRTEQMGDGRFQNSVEFIRMPENCRMILARQIFESQARIRKAEQSVD